MFIPCDSTDYEKLKAGGARQYQCPYDCDFGKETKKDAT